MNPRKLSAERFDVILQSIEEGRTITVACVNAGVGRSTFYRELDGNRDNWDALKKAEEQRDRMITDEAIRAVHSAFPEDWRSAAWWLERNHPDRYSLRLDLRPKPSKEGAITTEEDIQQLLVCSSAFRDQVRKMLELAELEVGGE